MAQAAGFSNLERFKDRSNKGKIIDQNVANSLTGIRSAGGRGSECRKLAMTGAGLDTGGNITNFAAKGIDAEGRDRSVNMAENVARFQVQNGSQNIAGFDIGNGANVTVKYNTDGSVAQFGAEGDGYSRFSHNAITGETFGTHSFTADNGLKYAQAYKGNERTTSFTDATGDAVVRQEQRDAAGQYNAYKTDITTGKNGYNLAGIGLQEGSLITQSAGGMTTANGAFTANGTTYKRTITTDENGAMVSITGENGKSFNQNDIDNITKDRTIRNSSGKIVSTGDKYDFDDQAMAQAIAAGKGDKALGIVMEQYNASPQYEEQLREYRMVGKLNNPYQENYQKALAEYSISAANGLSGVVGMSKVGYTSKDIAQSYRESDSERVYGGGSIGIEAGTKGLGTGEKADAINTNASIGLNAGMEKSYAEEHSTLQSKSETMQTQITRNELTARVRNEVMEGLKQWLSEDQIDRNINENILSR